MPKDNPQALLAWGKRNIMGEKSCLRPIANDRSNWLMPRMNGRATKQAILDRAKAVIGELEREHAA
ncbi:MAG: hypothetical protein WAL02_17490 [Rhodoplanes sp.]